MDFIWFSEQKKCTANSSAASVQGRLLPSALFLQDCKHLADACRAHITYHLEVIDAAVDSSQHLLPLLRGLWAGVERRTEPAGAPQSV